MSVSARYAFGEGPGVITPDGCAVELYSLLPPGRTEAEFVASVVHPGGTVLELGAGAGRVTRCLLERGLSVVAVDEAAEMLARIDGADTVQSPIEKLDLRRVFDVVVLGSHLVNVPDDDAAGALLATCARHVAPDGHVLVERHPPEWFDVVREAEVDRGGILYKLVDVVRPAPELVTATAIYTVGDRTWSQTFTTRRIDDEQLTRLLESVGLDLTGFLDQARTWADARRSDRR